MNYLSVINCRTNPKEKAIVCDGLFNTFHVCIVSVCKLITSTDKKSLILYAWQLKDPNLPKKQS
jgi:hypothetical protein